MPSHQHLHQEHGRSLSNRAPIPRPLPFPTERIEMLLPNPVVKRDTSTAASSSPTAQKSCGPKDTTGFCERPVTVANTTTIPIVLGVLLPLVFALSVLIYLHRRHLRKLRAEDANDRHKSLDFGMGMDGFGQPKKGKRGKRPGAAPEMSMADAEKSIRRNRGMSLDIDSGNPYLLPPGLHQSRESVHSLSRSIQNGDDRYRPATTFIPDDGSAPYPASVHRTGDDASSFTASSSRRAAAVNESSQNLLRNAQRIDSSLPPTRRASDESSSPPPFSRETRPTQRLSKHAPSPPPHNTLAAPEPAATARDSYMTDVSKDGHTTNLRNSNNYLAQFIRSGAGEKNQQSVTDISSKDNSHLPGAPLERKQSPPQGQNGLPRNPKPDRKQSLDRALPEPPTTYQPEYAGVNEHEDYGDRFQIQPPSPTFSPHGDREPQLPQLESARNSQLYQPDFGYDVRRLSMGIRPLPPDDPTEDPETRAIRIRSFYKEYFDESKPSPVFTQQDYYDGSEEFAYDGPIYDPASGSFVNSSAPYAEPINRRAMTPPPRGPRQMQGPHMSGSAYSEFTPVGSRAGSSASGQFGNRRPLPKKKLPPPAPLHNLPTPHMLKDDTFLPIDFAPPSTARERRAGTPDSLRGGLRPYSPAVHAHLPLTSSFDDLSIMPSPHALRKSGTFTGLDFAPPPRFKDRDGTSSDAGSIRSNRSGMSQVQLHAVRAGAYRVSRIPREVAGTKQELAASLRPQWDMRK